jgi:hypothetical protein
VPVFCGLDKFKFTPEKQALPGQHIPFSRPKGAGEKCTLLAELRTELPRDSHPGEFCYAPGSRNCVGLPVRGRFRPNAELGNALWLMH